MKLSGPALLCVGRVIYFSLHWVFLAAHSLSLGAVSGDCSLVAMQRLVVASLAAYAVGCLGFGNCGAWA